MRAPKVLPNRKTHMAYDLILGQTARNWGSGEGARSAWGRGGVGRPDEAVRSTGGWGGCGRAEAPAGEVPVGGSSFIRFPTPNPGLEDASSMDPSDLAESTRHE